MKILIELENDVLVNISIWPDNNNDPVWRAKKNSEPEIHVFYHDVAQVQGGALQAELALKQLEEYQTPEIPFDQYLALLASNSGPIGG
jgi:hypothetical protein